MTALWRLGEGRHSTGDSIYFLRRGDSARWEYRFKRNNKTHSHYLGRAIGPDAITLSTARAKPEDFRSALRNGAPIMAVNAAQPSPLTLTFEQARDRYFEKLGTPQPDALSRLQRYATALNARPIAAITSEEATDVLKAAGWNGNKGHTAARLRAHIEAVLSANDLIGPEKNPADWRRLKHQPALRVEKAAETVNRASLDWRRMAEFFAKLDSSLKACALRFTILTASRINETLGATWREIDLKAKTWTIPAERMKSGRVHIVPLSDAAIACLGNGGADDALVFDLSEKTTLRLAQKIAPGVTQHGFRSSFTQWALTAKYRMEAVDVCLAHAEEDKTRDAYKRELDLLDERREIMQAWAEFCAC